MAVSEPDPGSPAHRFLRAVERRAQERAGLARAALAAILYVVILVTAADLAPSEEATMRQVEAGKAFLIVFGATGLAVYVLARRGLATQILPYLTVALDAALILGNLAYNHVAAGLPGNVTFLFPVIWIVPIALAANAIYFRPGLQLFATSIYLVGIPAISLAAGNVVGAERVAAMLRLQASLGQEPNAVRLSMLVAAGLILVLAALQGRRLLERAVRETELRLNLTRYLPRELAPVLSDDAFAALRAGQRLRVALLFVDIRGSTAMGGAMDPTVLAQFVSAFRSRVAQAASRHGGVIDKFIGDGALIVFGVPRPDESDAERALACARMLVTLVEAWNVERGPEPPVEIGVGVHCGDVFCGVLGDEARLEFTVLGDPVNVAARLEAATKALGGPILASADVVDASREARESWREVTREPLRGVGRAITILAPHGSGRA